MLFRKPVPTPGSSPEQAFRDHASGPQKSLRDIASAVQDTKQHNDVILLQIIVNEDEGRDDSDSRIRPQVSPRRASLWQCDDAFDSRPETAAIFVGHSWTGFLFEERIALVSVSASAVTTSRVMRIEPVPQICTGR